MYQNNNTHNNPQDVQRTPQRPATAAGQCQTAGRQVSGRQNVSVGRTQANPGSRKPRKTHKKKKPALRAVGRVIIVILIALTLFICGLLSMLNSIVHGPSITMRDQLVLSAMQASATKWLPGLFLDDTTVKAIVDASHEIKTDITPIDSYTDSSWNGAGQEGGELEWIDGIAYTTISGPTYRAYVMLIKDPARVYIGTTDFNSGAGIRIFDIAEREGAVAAINAGEYSDLGGQGIGDLPIGVTYSLGKCVWDDGIYNRTFIGFNSDNKLIVREGMTKKDAEALGIRDSVCFQTGNTLITNDGTNVSTHYADSNTGTAQRTAIGQAADGTVIMVVTDGRSASSLGATHNDVIDIMTSFGAISAGMLDGGSSTMMYYRDYWDVIDGIDYNSLDEYQRRGIVNKYKAFTTPRRMPTYFLVRPTETN